MMLGMIKKLNKKMAIKGHPQLKSSRDQDFVFEQAFGGGQKVSKIAWHHL
jgi:hypothetical protein